MDLMQGFNTKHQQFFPLTDAVPPAVSFLAVDSSLCSLVSPSHCCDWPTFIAPNKRVCPMQMVHLEKNSIPLQNKPPTQNKVP